MGSSDTEVATEFNFFAGDIVGDTGSETDKLNIIFFIAIWDKRREYFVHFRAGEVIAGLDVFDAELFGGNVHHTIGVIFNIHF